MIAEANLADRLELIVGLIAVIAAILSKLSELRAKKDATLFEKTSQVAVAAAEAFKIHLPRSTQKKITGEIQALAEKSGVGKILHSEVVKITKEIKAIDDDGSISPDVASKINPADASTLLKSFLSLSLLVLVAGCSTPREASYTADALHEGVVKHLTTCKPTDDFFSRSFEKGIGQEEAFRIWTKHCADVEATARKLKTVLAQ